MLPKKSNNRLYKACATTVSGVPSGLELGRPQLRGKSSRSKCDYNKPKEILQQTQAIEVIHQDPNRKVSTVMATARRSGKESECIRKCLVCLESNFLVYEIIVRVVKAIQRVVGSNPGAITFLGEFVMCKIVRQHVTFRHMLKATAVGQRIL